MAHDVFISYSSKDKTVADAVCATLENRKIRCWIAPRDVPPGQPYATALVNAINDCKVFVLILSKGSNTSGQVLREVEEAVNNGTPIIPLRIEDFEPTDAMRYYVKSLHWLDAMTPPLERHLGKLTDRIQALLSVEAEEQPPPVVETVLEAPEVKRRPLPTWAIAGLVIAAVVIVGGGVWFASTRMGSAPEAPEYTSVTATSDKTTVQLLEATTTPGSSEWRTLSFHIPNETFWRQSEDGYTTIADPDPDTFAWSDEIVEGDLILTAEVTSALPTGSSTFIIYGDGAGFSYGCLIFSYGQGFAMITKHNIYHHGENWLVVSPGDFDFQEPTHIFRMEIIEGKASFYVDGQRVAFAFLPDEISRRGRIGLSQHWEEIESAGFSSVTYSNIRIKTFDNGE